MNSDPDDELPAWSVAIRKWRALPAEEKHRRRWQSIPRSVARSMAFAGHPVDLARLEAMHARTPMPQTPTACVTPNDGNDFLTPGDDQ